MVLFFGLWYWFYTKIRRNMLAKYLDNLNVDRYNIRGTSAWSCVFVKLFNCSMELGDEHRYTISMMFGCTY
ncbi:MAG: hypothetical protein QM762_30445 [Chryseolinea sp.]